MALIFFDGFDDYFGTPGAVGVGSAITDVQSYLAKGWDTCTGTGTTVGGAESLVGYSGTTTPINSFLAAFPGRYDGLSIGSYHFESTNPFYGRIGRKTFSTTYNDIIIGFAVYNQYGDYNSVDGMFNIRDVNYNKVLTFSNLNNSGSNRTICQYYIYDINSTRLWTDPVTTPQAVWNYFEIRYAYNPTTPTASIFEIRKNNALMYSGTINSATGPAFAIEFNSGIFNEGSPGIPGWICWYLDDIYVVDNTDSTGYLGNVHIQYLPPISDDSVQFTPSAGSNNFSRVADHGQDLLATTASSVTTGNQDTFGLGPLATTAGTINSILAVRQTSVVENTIGRVGFNDVMKASSTLYPSSVKTLYPSTGFTCFTGNGIKLTNPATSSAWTIGDLSSLKIGYKLSAAPANTYADFVLSDSPLFYYRMNDIGNGVMSDISSNANHGLYTLDTVDNNWNSIYTNQGYPSLIANIDSDYSWKSYGNFFPTYYPNYGQFTPLSGYKLNNTFALEAWVMPTTIYRTQDNVKQIAACVVSAGATTGSYGGPNIGITVQNGSNVFCFGQSVTNYSTRTAIYSKKTWVIGQIYHIVGVIDQYGYAYLYINGALDTVVWMSMNYVTPSTVGLIGRDGNNVSRSSFFGQVDEVAYYASNPIANLQTHYALGAGSNLNVLDKGANINLSNSNLTATQQTSTTGGFARGNIPRRAGKFYFEVSADTINGTPVNTALGITQLAEPTTDYIGQIANSLGYRASGVYVTNATTSGTPPSYTSTDIIQVATDLDAGSIWFGKNGTWNDGTPGVGSPSLTGFNPTVTIPSGTYAATVLADNPVGYWKLNETSGTTAIDYSTTGNNGTYPSGLSLGHTAIIGTDLTFQFGSTQGVNIPYNAAYNPFNVGTGKALYSAESWVRPTTLNNSVQIYFCGTYNSTPIVFVHAFNNQTTAPNAGLLYSPSGALYTGPSSTPTNVWEATSPETPLIVNNIYHFVTTYDSTTLRLYINGTLVSSIVIAGLTLNNTAQGIHVGGDWTLGTMTSLALANIAHCAYYNYVLTPAQILKHYQVGAQLAVNSLPMFDYYPTLSPYVAGSAMSLRTLNSQFTQTVPSGFKAWGGI